MRFIYFLWNVYNFGKNIDLTDDKYYTIFKIK